MQWKDKCYHLNDDKCSDWKHEHLRGTQYVKRKDKNMPKIKDYSLPTWKNEDSHKVWIQSIASDDQVYMYQLFDDNIIETESA